RQAGTFRLLPALFQQALLAQAHEQRIERPRAEACLLRKVVTMPPGSRPLEESGQQGASPARVVGFARHALIIDICRLLSSPRFWDKSMLRGRPLRQC